VSERLCAKCGAPIFKTEAEQYARLCAVHLQEAIPNTPLFVDGKDTGSTPSCHCDGPCPECPAGRPRKNCPICGGYGTLCCEFPCWQRVGLTSEPCCPQCSPLPEPDPAPVASVTALPSPTVPELVERSRALGPVMEAQGNAVAGELREAADRMRDGE
jgi:hypothetical protein